MFNNNFFYWFIEALVNALLPMYLHSIRPLKDEWNFIEKWLLMLKKLFFSCIMWYAVLQLQCNYCSVYRYITYNIHMYKIYTNAYVRTSREWYAIRNCLYAFYVHCSWDISGRFFSSYIFKWTRLFLLLLFYLISTSVLRLRIVLL